MRDILGIGEGWPMALIGVGNLGSALLAYDGFPRQGFRIVEAFDSDPRRVGTVIRDVVVKPMDQVRETIQERRIAMALLAVPAKAAQTVTERLIDAGVRCLLNFAPISLKVPPHVYLASVDLSIEVEYLSYLLRESEAEDTTSNDIRTDVTTMMPL
jgi:redox-sensing transcriptional repressor